MRTSVRAVLGMLALTVVTIGAPVALAGQAFADQPPTANGQALGHANTPNGLAKGRAPAVTRYAITPVRAGVNVNVNGDWRGDAVVLFPNVGDTLDPASITLTLVDPTSGPVLGMLRTMPSDDPRYDYTGWPAGGLIVTVSVTNASPNSAVWFDVGATGVHTAETTP
jgi:hypothetical protein